MGIPGRSFLERTILAISFLLTCPQRQVREEKRTLRRPLRVLTTCPLPCAVGSGEGAVDKPGDERQDGYSGIGGRVKESFYCDGTDLQIQSLLGK